MAVGSWKMDSSAQYTFLAVKNKFKLGSITIQLHPPKSIHKSFTHEGQRKLVYCVGAQFLGTWNPKYQTSFTWVCLNPPLIITVGLSRVVSKQGAKREQKGEKNVCLQELRITVNKTNPNIVLTSHYSPLIFPL